MRLKFAASLLPMALALAGPAYGQGDQPVRTTELDAIIVTADRHATSVREVTQSVTVITEEDLKKSGADTVTDVLKQYGIQVYSDGAEGYGAEGIVMRGGRSSMHGFDLAGDILVLVDGRRTGADSFSNIDMGNTARIEVIRGPGAVQYGAAAMGGVINIITKRGGETPEARFEAGFGSRGESRVQGGFSGRAGTDKQLDFSASASYYTKDDYKIGGDGGLYENSDLDYRVRYNMNMGWNFNERHRVGLTFQGSKTEDAGKGPDSSARGTGAYKNTRQNRKNHNFDLSYEGRSDDEARFWLARYFQGEIEYDLSRYYTHKNYDARLPFSDTENKIKGAQAQFGWDLGRFEFVTGVDWISYDYEQSQTGVNANTANATSSDFENIGAFVLTKVHLLENRNLTLSAGLRYDDFDVDVTGTKGNPVANTRKTNSKIDNWAPSVGLAYGPFDWVKLRANYSQAFRMPTPKQLGGLSYMTNFFVGNPDLEPEESDNWDIGFDVNYNALSFSATYFHSKYENMIVYEKRFVPEYEPDPNKTVNFYVNVDKATVKGLEVGASYDIGEHLGWDCRLEPYVYLTHLLKFEDGDGNKLADRARNSLSSGLKFHRDDIGLTINLDSTYYGTQYNSDSQRLKNVGGVTVWDLYVAKRIHQTQDFGELGVKVVLKNIFDKEYSSNKEQWMPGSSAYVGLVWSY